MIGYIKKLLLILLWINAAAPQTKYAPILQEDVCKHCECVEDVNDNIKADQLVVDCSRRNFELLIPVWPEHEIMKPDDIQDGSLSHYKDYRKDIIVTFSGNSIKLLQELPATEARVQFSCRHCDLDDIVNGAFLNTPNIVRLDLSYNKLTDNVLKPETFRGRYNEQHYEPIYMAELDLSYNEISSLDSKLFEHIPNLKRLSLQHNPFNVLDANVVQALSSLQHLEYLNLAATGLSDLNTDLLKSLVNLKVLIVYGNNFVTVPESLVYARKTLMSLYIGDNPIEFINSNSFLGLAQLTHLNMSGLKNLTEIKDDSFSPLKSLEVLKAFGNPKLTKVNLTSLATLAQFRELDISNCGLKHLEINLVSNSENAVQQNALDDGPDESLFPNLRVLKLEGNPWYCNCELLRHLRQLNFYKNSQNHNKEDDARCSGPYQLSGTLLIELVKKPVCNITEMKKPKIPVYDPPQYLRPRSIAISIISVVGVILLGLLIGFGIVIIKKKMRENDFGFASPVRYTTVRESAIPITNTNNFNNNAVVV